MVRTTNKSSTKILKKINVIDEGKPIEINNSKEVWSEYELADGTKMRIKPLVMDVIKSHLKDASGNHQYHIRSSMVIDVQPISKVKK